MEVTKIQFRKPKSSIWNTIHPDRFVIRKDSKGMKSIEFLFDLPLKCQIRIESSLPPIEEIIDCDFSIIHLTKE